MNGYLATITSAAENQMISENLFHGSGSWYFLGGTDELNEGEWRWLTGETWDYTNWYSNQPDNYGGNPLGFENHLEILDFGQTSHYFGKWNDIVEIGVRSGYIVEYNPVPEPTTMLLLGAGLIGFAGVRRKQQ